MTKQRLRRRNIVQAAHLSKQRGAGKHTDKRIQAQRKWAYQQLTQPTKE